MVAAVGLSIGAPSKADEIRSSKQAIINGTVADVGEYPFAAFLSIERNDGTYLCSGSLVDPLFVLTAAHCVIGGDGTKATTSAVVRIGAVDYTDGSQGETRTVVEVTASPRFRTDRESDVALLKLDRPSAMRPLDLATPEGPSDAAFWPAESPATAIGWGITDEGRSTSLREAAMTVRSDTFTDARADAYGKIFTPAMSIGATGPNSTICAGDSGGPLFVDTPLGRQQIGVVSRQVNGVCDPSEPAIFTEIAGRHYSRWVRSIIDRTALVGDVDGDGDGDLVFATHQPEKRVSVSKSLARDTGHVRYDRLTTWHDNFVNDGDQVLLADFNGDRKADIWAIGESDAWVAASTGTSFFGAGGTWGRGLVRWGETVRTGDFDGDGRADLFIFSNNADRDVFVARSTATGFGPRVKVSDNAVGEGQTPDVIDLNSDRRADVVEFHQGLAGTASLMAYLSDGVTLRGSDFSQFPLATAGKHATVGYFNSDWKGDIVVFDRDLTTFDVNVALRHPSSAAFVAGGKWHEWFGWLGHTLDAADVNGDGLDDIVAFTNGGPYGEYWVALNEGGARFGTGVLVSYYDA